jgi:hypothetical protein
VPLLAGPWGTDANWDVESRLCGGYCSTGLTVDDLTADLSADEITEMVLRGEGLDPVMTDRKQAASVLRTVEDWLFDPRGRGIKSGLPH